MKAREILNSKFEFRRYDAGAVFQNDQCESCECEGAGVVGSCVPTICRIDCGQV